MMVGAFDGSKRITLVEIGLKIGIRPCQAKVRFIVVHILATMNMLLGHSCIRIAEAIPSSLHQKLKFIKGDGLITIMVERKIPVHSSLVIHFIGI